MSNRNSRRNSSTVSQSTKAAADLRNGTGADSAPAGTENADQTMARVLGTVPTGGLPVPTDAELDAGINTIGTTVENVSAILDSDINNRGRGNAHKSNFQAADDVSKKGPYASESEARLPFNVYRNQGKTAWELYEVEVPGGYSFGGMNPVDSVYTWACNADLAIAFVARKAGWESTKAGAKTPAASVKTKLSETTAELEKVKAEREALLAKLKAAGIEL